MPDSQANPKIFTLAEANALLPQVRLALGQVRHAITQVLAHEARVDALELLDGGADSQDGHETAPPPTVARELTLLEQQQQELRAQFEAFERLGCHLKDLDAGLVDFYTQQEGELALLCWHEGEDRIGYWHAVDAGYADRRPIPGA